MSAPALTFAVRGDSMTARYAPGGNAAPGIINGVTQVGSSDPGVLGTGYIDLSSSSACRALSWNAGGGNFPASNKISILIRAAIIGSTSAQNGLAGLGWSQQIGTLLMGFQSATLFQDAESLTAISDIGLNSGAWTPTLGQYYDILFVYDMTSTAADSLLIYADAVQIATNNNTSTWGSPPRTNLAGYTIDLGANQGFNATRIRVNEFLIWDGLVDPTSVPLTSGSGALNGNSRTAFVDVAAFVGGAGATGSRGRFVNAGA